MAAVGAVVLAWTFTLWGLHHLDYPLLRPLGTGVLYGVFADVVFIVAATVGMILRTIEERMGLIGRLVMRIIGIAWTLACYFVVPVLAFEDLTPIAAVKRSSKLFRNTWGEKVIGGLSFSLVSLVLMLPGFGLWFVAIVIGGVKGLLAGFALLILYILMLSVMMSTVQGIFNAALYRYACFKQVPAAFDADLVKSAWTAKS